MHRRPFVAFVAVVLPAAVLLAGCAQPTSKKAPEVKVSGKVVRGGNPLPLDPAQAASKAAFVMIKFVSAQGDYSNSAFANVDGTFSTSLPKGKYGVQITHMGPGGDQLKGKFADRKAKALIEKEISGDTADFVIELNDYK